MTFLHEEVPENGIFTKKLNTVRMQKKTVQPPFEIPETRNP